MAEKPKIYLVKIHEILSYLFALKEFHHILRQYDGKASQYDNRLETEKFTQQIWGLIFCHYDCENDKQKRKKAHSQETNWTEWQ